MHEPRYLVPYHRYPFHHHLITSSAALSMLLTIPFLPFLLGTTAVAVILPQTTRNYVFPGSG